ncbi:hypothetical protein ASPZODRAFT_131039 [Penicilliopsis zonata CBS 506.65]|uniref:Uncharacterized protein n=1 Tax=Penicilliopsis zonata CBS 506.65 TaxID=1073090 RepID=A0A1L9SK31_9EURO|nr:hypothetical protein ASPZODRAFT_131039 [Penicilliopsis zonata CBS 506.65]OJJ47525.1 hypothetical protein ASPZODRAFT_131039 [Penicilliopsis zonata CBS 506.65]
MKRKMICGAFRRNSRLIPTRTWVGSHADNTGILCTGWNGFGVRPVIQFMGLPDIPSRKGDRTLLPLASFLLLFFSSPSVKKKVVHILRLPRP